MSISDKKISLSHGSGGGAAHRLIEEIFLKRFHSDILNKMNDSACLSIGSSKLAFTTDSYVIYPIFFPGGDIGKLAVNGTVNDISAGGGKPLYMSVSFIIEEGVSIVDLSKIADSIALAAELAGVEIVTGDTKVVGRGGMDKLFINTSGIGIIDNDINIDASNAAVGDKIIISGTIGDHGIAILSVREGIAFNTRIISDTAPLNCMVSKALEVCRDIHVMRDPTRGGVAAALNEIAISSSVGIDIYEKALPVNEEVRGACEILGLDPLYIANEGKMLIFVPENSADKVLETIKKDKYGVSAAIVGEVVDRHKGKVYLQTVIGGERVVDMPAGEQLPRIC